MSLITSESRERNAFLENTQAEFKSTLEMDEVITRLGEPAVKALLDINNLLYVPDTRHGGIRIPSRLADTNQIPLIALRPNEQLFLTDSMSKQTPIQRQASKKIITSMLKRVGLDDYTTDPEVTLANGQAVQDSMRLALNSIENKGYTASRKNRVILKPGRDPKLPVIVHGRPLIALNYLDPVAHVSLSHEATHGLQLMTEPVVSNEPYAYIKWIQRCELGGYKVGSSHGDALYYSETYWMRKNVQLKFNSYVERIRASTCSEDDPFEPNKQMLEKLREKDVIWAKDFLMPVV